MTMKITSHICQVGGSEESHVSDASVFLIVDGREAALVDAGTGRGHNEIISNIERVGVHLGDIKYLFLTHCHYDHTGGANALRIATDCRVIAHELDSVFIENGNSEVTAASWYGATMEPTPVDIKVQHSPADFRVGSIELKFYHTPGHSPGSAVLTAFSDGRLVLFGQDVHGPLNDVILSNRGDYLQSLEFMLSLEADIICEGHFGVYFGKENVRRYIESFL